MKLGKKMVIKLMAVAALSASVAACTGGREERESGNQNQGTSSGSTSDTSSGTSSGMGSSSDSMGYMASPSPSGM